MKNAFYFMLKSFFSRSFFCPDYQVIQKNSSIRGLWLISKLMTSQTGQQIIAIQILLNISRSTGNQTIKSGQLIEYNIRKIFLEKSWMKCGGEASPRPFYKKSKLNISLDQQYKILWRLFLSYVHVEVYQNIVKLRS